MSDVFIQPTILSSNCVVFTNDPPFSGWDHSFSTYAKFSKKLTFLTPLYAHVRAGIME